MSATVGRQPLTDAEKEARKNETKRAKLNRLGGPRVNKALNALDKVADLGPLIHEAAKEGVNVEAVVGKIQSAIAERFKSMSVKLASGERTNVGFSIDV